MCIASFQGQEVSGSIPTDDQIFLRPLAIRSESRGGYSSTIKMPVGNSPETLLLDARTTSVSEAASESSIEIARGQLRERRSLKTHR